MKKIIPAFVFLLLSSSSFAQDLPLDQQTGLISYQDVVDENGSKEVLFDRAIAWVKSHYRNPMEVLGQRSAEEGFINAKASFRLQDVDKKGNKTPAGLVHYTFKLEFRENRYRYTFTDFRFQAASRFPLERWLTEKAYQTPVYKSYLQQIDQHILDNIQSLIKGMEAVEEKRDEW